MKKIMLDSGAYSAWRRGVKIDIDQYAEFCKTNSSIFETCVNLDVIGDGKGSYENWLYLRKLGVNTLPVFHVGTDDKWLVKYMKKTDYIAVGAVARLSSSQRVLGLTNVWNNHLVDKKTRMPLVKVHGMGLTALKIILRYPWYSVDSITPILAAGYGGVFVPAIRNGELDFLGLDVYKISDQFKHERGNMGSFVNIPTRLRKQYEKYFKQEGYKLGEMTGIQTTLPKKKDDPRYIFRERLFDITTKESDPENNPTLANSGKTRRSWNLKMWHELRQHLPEWNRPFINSDDRLKPAKDVNDSTLLYVGGTFDVLQDVIKTKVDLEFLFSYIVVNDNFIPRLKLTLKGKEWKK